ncbi:MAG: alpha/beta hydrolase-fold protein [Erythrobacter sp.]
MNAGFAASLLMLQSAAVAEPEIEPLTIGETITLTVLDEARKINVVLPTGYHDDPTRTWPTVYMLDGAREQDLMLGVGIAGWNRLWGRSQPVIWVGIETKDRQREMLPPTLDDEESNRYPTAGESEEFREWLITKVTSTIEARYRVNGTDYLVGESAAGHFVLETWVEAASAFDGYAAISPSLQWNSEALSKRIEAQSGERAPLYISVADEGGALESGVLRVVGSLEGTQEWCFSDRRADLKHATSLHGLLPEALQYLMPTGAAWLEGFGFTLRCDQKGS